MTRIDTLLMGRDIKIRSVAGLTTKSKNSLGATSGLFPLSSGAKKTKAIGPTLLGCKLFKVPAARAAKKNTAFHCLSAARGVKSRFAHWNFSFSPEQKIAENCVLY